MLSIEIVKALLLNNGGKFFSVEFTKVDGSTRKLNGRFGVNGAEIVSRDGRGLIVYDVQSKGYRTVTLERVKAIKTQSMSIVVQDGIVKLV